MFWTRKFDFQLDLCFENGHVTWLQSRATCNGFLFLTLKDKLGTQSELTDSEIALQAFFDEYKQIATTFEMNEVLLENINKLHSRLVCFSKLTESEISHEAFFDDYKKVPRSFET